MPAKRDTLGFLIVDLSRLMRRAFQQRLEGTGLTPAQARALVRVSRQEGVRQVDLAEGMEVQPITLARLIDQLVAAGLVERRADPRDRRANHIHLTGKAAPHLAAIERITARIRAEALASLDEREAEALHSALQTMRDNLASR